MLASATEVEVELHVPDEVSTFFGVTWAQDPRKDKIFIRAFPRGSNGRRGLLESTGLVEIDDCLTAINGVSLGKSNLHEVMATIRSAKSPLSLRFARYPTLPLPQLSAALPSSPTSQDSGASRAGSGKSVGFSSGSPSARSCDAASGDSEKNGDAELDDVLNSALVLGLGERVAGIQKRNVQLLRAVDRISLAATDKRQGVERVASSAASLTATAGALPHALRALTAARQDATAVCEAMARLDDLLAARERAQVARRRSNGESGVVGGGGGAIGGSG
ncbi:unnamed protein product [Laminaria digitata]